MTLTQPTRADYFRGDKDGYRGRKQLYFTTDPHARAVILAREADLDDHKSRLHTAVFGPDPIPHEDGRDLAESLASSAILLRIIAQAERERGGEPPIPFTGRDLELWTPVRNLYYGFTEGAPRVETLEAMGETWYPIVGGQAAEAVFTIPDGSETRVGRVTSVVWVVLRSLLMLALAVGILHVAVRELTQRTGLDAGGTALAASLILLAVFLPAGWILARILDAVERAGHRVLRHVRGEPL